TLMVLVAPAFRGIKSAGDVTSAAYTIKDALEQARTHAMAYETYVWIGFYEEPAGQPSTNPATPGTGRIVISTIASADGTTVYNPRSLAAIDPTRVTQLNNLVKVEGTHLATFPDGSGTGDTFDSRPAAIYETAKIGDTTPPNPLRIHSRTRWGIQPRPPNTRSRKAKNLINSTKRVITNLITTLKR